MNWNTASILRPAVRDVADLEDLGLRIIKAVSQPLEVAHRLELAAGVSIGIAVDHPGSCQADELVDAADTALYHIKSGGGGGIRVAPNPSATGEFRRPILN